MSQVSSQQDIIQQIMSQEVGDSQLPRQMPNLSGGLSNFLTSAFGNPEEQEGARQAQQAEFARMQQSNTRIAMANAEMKRRLMMDKLTAATEAVDTDFNRQRTEALVSSRRASGQAAGERSQREFELHGDKKRLGKAKADEAVTDAEFAANTIKDKQKQLSDMVKKGTADLGITLTKEKRAKLEFGLAQGVIKQYTEEGRDVDEVYALLRTGNIPKPERGMTPWELTTRYATHANIATLGGTKSPDKEDMSVIMAYAPYFERYIRTKNAPLALLAEEISIKAFHAGYADGKIPEDNKEEFMDIAVQVVRSALPGLKAQKVDGQELIRFLNDMGQQYMGEMYNAEGILSAGEDSQNMKRILRNLGQLVDPESATIPAMIAKRKRIALETMAIPKPTFFERVMSP